MRNTRIEVNYAHTESESSMRNSEYHMKMVSYLALALLSASPVISEEVLLDLLVGEWLNNTYLEEMKTTRSPLKAYLVDEDTDYTALYFSRKDTFFEWKQSYAYHEGTVLQITGLQPDPKPNIYRFIFHEHQTHGRATDEDRLLIPDDTPLDEITWLSWLFYPRYGDRKRERRITYIRVEPTIEQFVNRSVLAGAYTDEKQRSFKFKETGIAVWPETTFAYVVNLDRHWTNGEYDIFHCRGDSTESRYVRTYAFEWKNNKLLIFSTEKTDMTIPRTDNKTWIRNENPLYILTPQ